LASKASDKRIKDQRLYPELKKLHNDQYEADFVIVTSPAKYALLKEQL